MSPLGGGAWLEEGCLSTCSPTGVPPGKAPWVLCARLPLSLTMGLLHWPPLDGPWPCSLSGPVDPAGLITDPFFPSQQVVVNQARRRQAQDNEACPRSLMAGAVSRAHRRPGCSTHLSAAPLTRLLEEYNENDIFV